MTAGNSVSLWDLAPERPWSISGVELQGSNMSRSVYLDESGTDIHSSVAVVAAVIVDTDAQWKPVERYIYDLIQEFAPPEIQDGFVLHAKDLFHGWTKNVFDRKKHSFPQGPEVLRRLLEAPAKFGLALTFGYVRRPEAAKYLTNVLTGEKRLKEGLAGEIHAEAYVRAVLPVENYMRTIARPGELAKLVAEDSAPTKKAVEEAQTLLMGQNLEENRAKKFLDLSWSLRGGLPLDRIVGSIAFEKKTDNPLLQLADACAYILQRFHEGKPHNQQFIDALTMGNTVPLHRNTGVAGGNGFLLFGDRFVQYKKSPISVATMPNQDANKKALDHVEKATESEPVKGEELLESPELKRQLREAKEHLNSDEANSPKAGPERQKD
jgi:hypothetical protein